MSDQMMEEQEREERSVTQSLGRRRVGGNGDWRKGSPSPPKSDGSNRQIILHRLSAPLALPSSTSIDVPIFIMQTIGFLLSKSHLIARQCISVSMTHLRILLPPLHQ